jgi:hypothetical protein
MERGVVAALHSLQPRNRISTSLSLPHCYTWQRLANLQARGTNAPSSRIGHKTCPRVATIYFQERLKLCGVLDSHIRTRHTISSLEISRHRLFTTISLNNGYWTEGRRYTGATSYLRLGTSGGEFREETGSVAAQQATHGST